MGADESGCRIRMQAWVGGAPPGASTGYSLDGYAASLPPIATGRPTDEANSVQWDAPAYGGYNGGSNYDASASVASYAAQELYQQHQQVGCVGP
jgi:hypothetical protein